MMLMVYIRKLTWERARSYLLAFAFSLVTLALVFYPKEGFEAAYQGLRIFLDVVFPALLPFFVLSEILLGMGIVHFLGVFLEPLMRPLFNVPGVGAFAMSMGLVAGYPMDAVITAKFRENKMCTRIEGERLLAFTNTADPLFMFGAVAVGMFGMPQLGMTLAIAHYAASLTVGIVYRFYGRRAEPLPAPSSNRKGNMVYRAFQELYRARKEDGRPVGTLLGDSVRGSVETLVMICGFIMLFSVVVKVLSVSGVTRLVMPAVAGALRIFGMAPSLATAIIGGALEIDVGAMAAAKAAAPLIDRVAVASAVIAWSGLSVHGQVATVIRGTDIRMSAYVLARFVHAFAAGLYAYLLMGPAETLVRSIHLPVLARIAGSSGNLAYSRPFLDSLVFGGTLFVWSLGIMVGLALVLQLARKLDALLRQ